MRRSVTAVVIILTMSLLPACGGSSEDQQGQGEGALAAFAGVTHGVCVLSPTTQAVNQDGSNNVSGTITFKQTKSGLEITYSVSGLKPNSKHGWHIHEWGDVSDAQAGNATGSHYNPTKRKHGLPKVHDHTVGDHFMTGGHAGDLGNLIADENGNASDTKTFTNITLTGKNAVLGRAIIVHISPDDGDPDNLGNAGARIAQGVIGVANPK